MSFEDYWENVGARRHEPTHESRARHAWEACEALYGAGNSHASSVEAKRLKHDNEVLYDVLSECQKVLSFWGKYLRYTLSTPMRDSAQSVLKTVETVLALKGNLETFCLIREARQPASLSPPPQAQEGKIQALITKWRFRLRAMNDIGGNMIYVGRRNELESCLHDLISASPQAQEDIKEEKRCTCAEGVLGAMACKLHRKP